MRGRAGEDPFAVRTMVVPGEEIAFSAPCVTDAQRAAAGRETVARRARTLLAANRERAAAACESGGLPDGEEMRRAWCARDPAELWRRLGAEPFAAWAEGDVRHRPGGGRTRRPMTRPGGRSLVRSATIPPRRRGHDPFWWERSLPEALAWLLG